MMDKNILFVYPNFGNFGCKPIAIALLSAIAKEKGWNTQLLDTTEIKFNKKKDIESSAYESLIFKPVELGEYDLEKKNIVLEQKVKNILADFKPALIAISVLSIENELAAEISLLIKKFSGNSIIIWGGKYPTLKPIEALLENEIDFVCIGEGLDAFSEFLDCLEQKNHSALYSIKNIYGKKDDKIVTNTLRPKKMNLDELPYLDWSLFDKRQFYRIYDGKVYISGDHMIGWGCPFKCTYCINKFMQSLYENHTKIRKYSFGRIIEELKYLKNKYDLNFMRFYDEDFLLKPINYLKKLSKFYKEQINLPFTIETNPKTITEQKVKILKNMGCVSVTVGIETGNEKLRMSILNKKITNKEIIRAVSLLNKYKIRSSAFNMLGLPFETYNTYFDTVKINKKAKVRYPFIGFFYPFDKTKLKEISIENNFLNREDKVPFNPDFPALQFSEFTADELVEMKKAFVLFVKLPEKYYPYIKRSLRRDKQGNQLRKLLVEIYNNYIFKNHGFFHGDSKEILYLQKLKEIHKI